MAGFVARLSSIFGAVITSFVTTLRSRAWAVISSPASPWSTSSTPMRVPRNPDRIAEDASVSEFSLLIAVSRTTTRIGSGSAIERRRPPRRFPTLIVAPWAVPRAARSHNVVRGSTSWRRGQPHRERRRKRGMPRNCAGTRDRARTFRSAPGTLTCWVHRHRLSTSDRRHRLLTSSDRRPRAISIVAQIQRSQPDRPAPQAPDTISASVCRCSSRLEHLRRELVRRVAQEPPYPGAFASSASTKAATSAAAFVRRAGGHADR